ncbi:XkdW family protein [Paenibacillus graminis]|uniref:XkdW family protein n=1 Tax=Paenibacillus graminis TaxID=189425 RepID=UPI002DB89FB9|nr:XkdW family protein [Paenibacillus graminis]MEC0170491.1 XkdW family protein [Paenibacillus graminis]
MNIALAIMHLHPQAESTRDFIVQDNGPEPVLRSGAEEKGRVRYEIKPPEEGEKPVEGVHYRYGIDYNLLIEGEDYDIVERGPYIAVWNLDKSQPTEEELQAAWEAYQEAEANKPPELTEVEQLQKENVLLKAQNNALSERADFIEDIIAEMATRVYQ